MAFGVPIKEEDGPVLLPDIAAAFDTVDTSVLMNMLRVSGVSGPMLDFIGDYLAPRRAVVVVNGASSDTIDLRDMVFQGTILGPPLWNVFFKDVGVAVEASGGVENKFGDDLNVYKTYDTAVPNGTVFTDLRRCQDDVHEWAVQTESPSTQTRSSLWYYTTFRALGRIFTSLARPSMQNSLCIRLSTSSSTTRGQSCTLFSARGTITVPLTWCTNSRHIS